MTNWKWSWEIMKQLYCIGAGIHIPHERIAAVVYGPLQTATGFNRVFNHYASGIALRLGRLHKALRGIA